MANTLSVSAQLSLPDWVRARGMSIYQMALMGSSAAGAALWGQVAGLSDVRTSLVLAAASGIADAAARAPLQAVGQRGGGPDALARDRAARARAGRSRATPARCW